VAQASQVDGYTIFFSRSPGETVTALLREVDRRGDKLVDLRVERPSLEERFLQLTRQGDGA
jgi:ABC-2 type transport system ATP-binding protein